MIVVTGGSGFLGGALATALALRGEQVRAVQRSDVPKLRELGVEVGAPEPPLLLIMCMQAVSQCSSIPRSPVSVEENCASQVVCADLTDAEATRASLRGAAVVCHAAAMATTWGKLSDFKAANVTATGEA